MSKLVNISTAAKMTGVSQYELRIGAKQGRYPFLWCGNKRLFDPEQLAEIFRQRMEQNREEARTCAEQ